MKAIILAAGKGSRLEEFTSQVPKPLISVAGKSIMEYQIDALVHNNILDITIVTGYLGNKIKEFCAKRYNSLNINYVNNGLFDTTNNAYSLSLTKNTIDDDCLFMNADVAFEPDILSTILMAPNKNVVAADTSKYDIESMKITTHEQYVTGISKKIDKNDASAVSIDLYKFDKSVMTKIIASIENYIGNTGNYNQWTELFLNELFQDGSIQAVVVDVAGKKWYEIDTQEDLTSAITLFSSND